VRDLPAGVPFTPSALAAYEIVTALTIDELTVADEPARWRSFGFDVDGERCVLGEVNVRLAGEDAGRGIIDWSLRGIAQTELDGLPTRVSEAPPPAAAEHPNGVRGIDHVVAMTPELDRTVRALQDAGLDLRRVREEPTPAGAPRQAFFRLGSSILEVVQEPAEVVAGRAGGADGPARFWGLALCATDLERAVAAFGEHAGEIRSAVQPGRSIATVRRSAGLAIPLALMSAPEDRT
jgi:catechol 2,3-dioxygenase-like lactoylglutathione lyase family enzyme